MNFKRLISVLLLLTFAFNMTVFAQEKVVTGTVTDSKDGTPVANATVQVKGTKIATQTGADGKFKVKVASDDAILVITSVGFARTQVTAGAASTISLVQSNATLNEVVVVGYGSVKKKDLTGSITTVSSKDFQQGSITTPEQLISGKAAGVSITSNGGAPGAGSVIRIRGGASINASNDPLIVIDGIPLSNDAISGVSSPLSLINADDIESFTILRDAASTAIYGSRASNGVILITTKHAKAGSKGVFNFSTSFSVSKIIKTIKVMDANTFKTFVDTLAERYPSKVNAVDTTLLGTANTDWQKQIYQTALTSNTNLSYAGSYKNLPYRIGGEFLSQTGILKTDKLQRVTGTISLSPRLFEDHLRLEINLHASETQSTFANTGAIGNAISYDPTQPVYGSNPYFKDNPYFGWYVKDTAVKYNTNAATNPLEMLNRNNNKGTVDRQFGNLQADYKIHFLPDLHFVVNWGFDVSKGTGSNDWMPHTFNNLLGSHSPYKQKNNNETFQSYFSYIKNIKSIKSNINATLGYEYQDFYSESTNFYGFYGNGDTIANSKPQYPTSPSEHTIVSYYSRLVYSFDNKYILAASAREDGSSRFGPSNATFSQQNRWSFFPSLALTWRANQEKFLNKYTKLSDLKLRLSYGVTGNQDGLGNYAYQSVYTKGNTGVQYQLGNQFYNTYNASAYISNLIWEQTETYNVGLDYGFFNNRIYGALDVYSRKTKNLFTSTNLPAGSNFTNYFNVNLGNMKSNGVELALNIVPIKKENLTWEVGFNGAYDKHEITNLTFPGLTNASGSPSGALPVFMSPNSQINAVGYAPNTFNLYSQVYNTNGKPLEGIYDDRNRDGMIDDKDKNKFKSPTPNIVLGFTTSVTYKKWSANTVLRANFNNYVYNVVNANTAIAGNALNKGFLQNVPTDYFKTQFFNNQFLSNYYIENASFLKMDNIGFGYNAGKVLNNKASLRVGLNCQNVFTITKYTGLDPEVYGGLDNNTYPRPRVYTLSLNITY